MTTRVTGETGYVATFSLEFARRARVCSTGLSTGRHDRHEREEGGMEVWSTLDITLCASAYNPASIYWPSDISRSTGTRHTDRGERKYEDTFRWMSAISASTAYTSLVIE